MKKFKLSMMLILMSMLVFSACGGGGGGGSDDPDKPGDNPGDDPGDDPKDPTATLEIKGDTYTYTLPGGTEFNLMLTPVVAVTNTFPCNIDGDDSYEEATDIANVPARFIMGETEVTYQLWKEVYDWATDAARGTEKYTFANAGRQGGNWVDSNPVGTNQHPVTTVNWRDTIVWCNALTEYYNTNNDDSETDLVCVYTYNGSIIRDSSDANATACDGAVQSTTAKGFRLPGSMEWEYAARYRGTETTNAVAGSDGSYYTKGNSASGATADYSDGSATSAVAVYGVSSTAIVKSKGSGANALGLYDMSGNVWEWCYDISGGSRRVFRGGAFNYNAYDMQVGKVHDSDPYNERSYIGFRFCRTK